MQTKKLLAAVMSLCMVAGTFGYGAPVIAQPIAAQASAAEIGCYSYEPTAGLLFLRGEIDADAIKEFGSKSSVKIIIALEGSVFPEDCNMLIRDILRKVFLIDDV